MDPGPDRGKLGPNRGRSGADRPGGEMANQTSLRRQLGVPGATMLGLGSILGTGVFVSLALVTDLAAAWTPLAVALAALVATCNALSSAQLAAAYPRSGGTYEYGYRVLHPFAGFTAGWTFLWAKGASAATAALGFAAYLVHLWPAACAWDSRWVASGLVVALTLLVLSGLRRSNAVNTMIVSVTLLTLVTFVVAGAPRAVASNLSPPAPPPGLRSFLEAVALMFVAYTGYGRICTMGEEVNEPRKTIPRAIVVTLLVSALLYVSVGWVFSAAGGGAAFDPSGNVAALEAAAAGWGVPGLRELLAVGAITAMIGVLLNLVLGLSRVMLAMGRRRDLPPVVAHVNAKSASPTVSVLVVGALVLGLSWIGNVKVAWSFSAFTVLVYYALTNLAALRLPREMRLYSPLWSVGGLASCAFLAFWVEPRIWLAGFGVLALGAAWFGVARALGRRAA